MHLPALLALLPALGALGIRIIQSNDDGWAEQYVRSFHDALISSGHDAVLSAPAENKSGSSMPSLPNNCETLGLPNTDDRHRLPRHRTEPEEVCVRV